MFVQKSRVGIRTEYADEFFVTRRDFAVLQGPTIHSFRADLAFDESRFAPGLGAAEIAESIEKASEQRSLLGIQLGLGPRDQHFAVARHTDEGIEDQCLVLWSFLVPAHVVTRVTQRGRWQVEVRG